jgi:4-hydroxy-2-oxoheptanedioate aldolase
VILNNINWPEVSSENTGMVGSKSFAERLQTGERLLAASATMSPTAAELLGKSGFDWLFIDAEAHPLTQVDILNLIRAAEGTDAAPVVRMNNDHEADIRQVLDMGAAGVIIPLVKTAEQAVKIVQAAKFSPLGSRGVTAGRSNQYGYGKHLANYIEQANSETAVIVMIEESEGLANAEDIAAVRGLDGIFIGPGDLSISLGYPGEHLHPDMRAAYQHIAACARANQVALGTFPSSREMYDFCHEEGFRFFLTGLDTTFLRTAAVSRLNEMLDW